MRRGTKYFCGICVIIAIFAVIVVGSGILIYIALKEK